MSHFGFKYPLPSLYNLRHERLRWQQKGIYSAFYISAGKIIEIIAMNNPPRTINKFPIAKIDSYLASVLGPSPGKGLNLTLSYDRSEGVVEARHQIAQDSIPKNSVDFDLSPCSCPDLDTISLDDFINTPFETGSAYEFFDFAFMYSSRITCMVEFTGRAWKIQIHKTQGP